MLGPLTGSLLIGVGFRFYVGTKKAVANERRFAWHGRYTILYRTAKLMPINHFARYEVVTSHNCVSDILLMKMLL